MNVVGPHMPLDDFDIMFLANPPNQLPNPEGDVAFQYRLAVHRDEHEMIVQQINAVRTPTVFAHPAIVPQAS